VSAAEGPADSAGRPWAGRTFEAAPSPWAGDDGSAPPAYTAALAAFRAGEAGVEAVVDALRDVRLLVPLLADLAEAGKTSAGLVHDKKAELALVTVAGPDGRRVLPAFSSAESMAAWNRDARPVPAPARQVALGAAGDGTELVVIDAATDRFGLRRSALEALARDLPWTAPWRDPEVGRAIRRAVADEPVVTTARVATDDPRASLDGAELLVTVVLHETLDRQEVAELMARVQRRWTEEPVVRARVDSMTVRLEASFC
jgi:hypothetical protein